MRNIYKFHHSWQKIIDDENKKEYMLSLQNFLKEEKKQHNVFPKSSEIFHAFKRTSFNNTKVVIIGQDPYHGKDQANGLAFSVKKHIKIPPSLRNIFKEIQDDLFINNDNHGDLTKWADQGVLLLNSILTVREDSPRSHRNKGWEKFTNNIISEISSKKSHVIFMLWGENAQEKEALINSSHTILKSTHPSPLSCYRGFLGCRHFSRCNEKLIEKNKSPIDWKL